MKTEMNEKKTLWADKASWLCLTGSIINPFLMYKLAFSGFSLDSRQTTSIVLFIFVIVEFSLVAVGISSLTCLPKSHKVPILVRSVVGIIIGVCASFFMIMLALYAGVGP